MAREIMTVRVEPRTCDVHQWHIKHIRQGLSEAKAGQFASKAQVNRVVARLRKKYSTHGS